MTTLTEMAELARAMVDADKAVEQAEATLKVATESARQLREETIPAAMQELGLEELKLDTGEKLSIKQEVYASIPKANQAEAYAWLEEHGFGGLIKTEVSTPFGKGELEAAMQLVERLQSEGLPAEASQSVHAQTLKAFLREQLAQAADIPLELFGARPVWTAKLTKK